MNIFIHLFVLFDVIILWLVIIRCYLFEKKNKKEYLNIIRGMQSKVE